MPVWQELRNRIVPSARAYRLDKLMDALDGHLRGPAVPAPAAVPENGNGEADDGGGPAESKSGGHEEAKDGGEGAAEDDAGAVETIAGVVMVGGKGAGRRALIEYVMLAGVNDTEECGRELGELLKVSEGAGFQFLGSAGLCLEPRWVQIDDTAVIRRGQKVNGRWRTHPVLR